MVCLNIEIKKLAREDKPELREILDNIRRGQDIEENCFEDALELAVSNNSRKAVGYLVLHGARNLEKCMQAALLKSRLQRTAVLLLLCYASKVNDKDIVRLICTDLTKNQKGAPYNMQASKLTRKYLPREWSHTLTDEKVREMR